MDKLLIDLCCRLPYHPKGRLESGDGGVNGVLVGISFEDPLKPAVYVQVKGFKAPWTCDYTMFKPYLIPVTSGEDLGYESGYDINGLIEEGKALLWTP